MYILVEIVKCKNNFSTRFFYDDNNFYTNLLFQNFNLI